MPIMTMLVSRRLVLAATAIRRARRARASPGRRSRPAQIAHQALRAGVAEPAGERAADLARRRRACRDPPRGCGRSRPPARRRSAAAICGCRRPRGCAGDTPGPADDEPLGQLARGTPSPDWSSRRNRRGAAMIDPMPELAGAEGRLAELGEAPRCSSARDQADQIDAGRRRGPPAGAAACRIRLGHGEVSCHAALYRPLPGWRHPGRERRYLMPQALPISA